ncbi:MAG: aspartate dehydrogenase [Candidatus Thermoplasmatota archaeon]|nr:aspartate dehydrogenase [Candidatus Thermoplasmatota archaeon]MDD5779203.1 aspartate dehydrogenase [Candidatus Thermoplasmatota archaeon]
MDSYVLGVIGCGAIGSDVARAADAMEDISTIYLYDIKPEKAEELSRHLTKSKVADFDTWLPHVDIVFEAASHEAVKQYAEKVIRAGKDLIIMSIGGLLDEELRQRLEDRARETRSKIYLPSGAVCGIDGLKAARTAEVDEVTLVTTKSPASLDKNLDRRTIIFEGSAGEAVKALPKNVNVAACLALAGIGFERTRVKVVADPVVKHNSHKVLAHGKFGRLRAEVENLPNPHNPSSSYLASLSAIATLRRAMEPIQIGA